MSWREMVLSACGPGLLGGILQPAWRRLLAQEGHRVHPRHWLNAASISGNSRVNAEQHRLESQRYSQQVAATCIQPPLFVLGHWRSGTTLLHNLLTVDKRFAFPNLFKVLHPQTFLVTEARLSARMAPFVPRTRCGLDNVPFGVDVPSEDEFALAVSSSRSPYLSMVFPRARQHYDRYLTFRDVPDEDITAWRAALTWFFKKLTWMNGKPLVCKSPPHTCRIRLLLDLFPDARFVHIHRHPLAVYPSTQKLVAMLLHRWCLQSPRSADWNERIIRQYQEMYEAYFEERHLIPDGRFHEVSFERLERDPLGELRTTYRALDLPDFAEVEADVETYVDSLAGFRKNEFPPIQSEVRLRLTREWQRCFEEWGYDRSSLERISVS